ncbi:MAG: hypothetical protein CVV47_11800 [Spirochaetae bacterium HGW-Spirochaetae-3]|jgi:hypothetical protein|nr:MAG: hypothetical protein CVV47_11800 [Spirochaetae bacterium HGW-Spirochaetae-3]
METKDRGARGHAASLAAIVAALFLPLTAGAAPDAAPLVSTPLGATTSVDWTIGVLRADVELDLAAAGIRLPSGRSQAERSLEEAVPDLVRGAALSVELDSYRTVADSLTDGTLDPAAFEAFLGAGRRIKSSLSRDLGRLVASYEWKLADLASLYVRHSVPIDLPAPDRYAPTRAYTGIVVYAKGEYGVRGEHRDGKLRPCLFPRLYDEAMHPLVERNLLYPDALRAWGAVGYATGLSDPIVEARAGAAPLRIMASQIFGSHRTDAIINADDALKILGSPENRELARQGKIVFVIDAP